MTDTVETALTPISQARQRLAEATTLPELRELRDFATGAKAWAKARGLGVEAENEATEVVLRAERGIGKNLAELSKQGALQWGGSITGQHGIVSDLMQWAGTLDYKDVPLADFVRAFPQYKREKVQSALLHSAAFDRVSPGVFRLNPAEVARRESLPNRVTLEELGLNNKMSAAFQALAMLDDDRFEAMIRSVKALPGVRLAKTNFYAAVEKADRVREGRPAEEPNPNNPDFDRLRAGAFGLLGWEVDADGREGPTKNDLTLLPDDQMRQLASIIKALAIAYNEAKAARDA